MTLHFMEDQLRQFTEMVWLSILNLPIHPSTTPYTPKGKCLEGCVQITGSWQGLIALHCPESLATKFAEIMFHKKPGHASASEVNDAVGELANMVGGNLKALLPAPCHLSIPVVASHGARLHFPMTQTQCEMNFVCQDEEFQVTILKQKEYEYRKA